MSPNLWENGRHWVLKLEISAKKGSSAGSSLSIWRYFREGMLYNGFERLLQKLLYTAAVTCSQCHRKIGVAEVQDWIWYHTDHKLHTIQWMKNMVHMDHSSVVLKKKKKGCWKYKKIFLQIFQKSTIDHQ